MIDYFITFVEVGIFLILFAVGLTNFATYLNRHFLRIRKEAKLVVRQRLLERNSSTNNFFQSKELSREELLKARWILKQITEIVGWDDNGLYPNDKLGELLKVHRTEFRTISDLEWKKAGLQKDYIVVFDDEIMGMLEKCVASESVWKDKISVSTPETEEEWYSFLLETELVEMVCFLVPTIRECYRTEWQLEPNKRREH